MAKKEGTKKSAPKVQLGPNEVAITRTGGKVKRFPYTQGLTAGKLMGMAETALKKGEMLVRDGARIKNNTLLKPGNVVFITADDGNGN